MNLKSGFLHKRNDNLNEDTSTIFADGDGGIGAGIFAARRLP